MILIEIMCNKQVAHKTLKIKSPKIGTYELFEKYLTGKQIPNETVLGGLYDIGKKVLKETC